MTSRKSRGSLCTWVPAFCSPTVEDAKWPDFVTRLVLIKRVAGSSYAVRVHGEGQPEGLDPGRKTPASKELDEAIGKSRRILDLPDDRDTEGSPRYLEATWQRAVSFLRTQAQWHTAHLRGEIPIPRILPGPSGSIDLHWKSAHSELLVNFPQDPAAPATFYGDDYGSACIKGTIRESGGHLGLLCWLSNLECAPGR